MSRLDLGSSRLAFVLIALFIAMIVVSAVIPQQGIAQNQILDWRAGLGDRYELIERLGLDRIYFSPPFFVVLAMLAVNLVVGNSRRFRTVLRVERTLLKARHVGSILFHLALLVVISGVILNYLFKFQAAFGLTEGQTANDEPGQYHQVLSGPLYNAAHDRFQVSLLEVHEAFEVGGATTEAATITLRSASASAETRTIFINRPLVWGGLEFHFGPRIGFSPEVLVTTSEGEHIFRGFVRLASRRVDGRDLHEDFLHLPDALSLKVSVDPMEAGDAPQAHVLVEQNEEVLFQGSIAPGDTARAGDLRVSVPRLRRWCYVDVVENPYLGVIFSGFWLALTGLLITAMARVFRTGGPAV